MNALQLERKEAVRKLPHIMTAIGEIIVTDRVPTAAVDRDGNVYVNPKFVEYWPHPPGYVLAHEALHIALRHWDRIGNRNLAKWNLATDCTIAVILHSLFKTTPLDAIHPERLGLGTNHTAEEYYDLIPDYVVKNKAIIRDNNFEESRPWEMPSSRKIHVPRDYSYDLKADHVAHADVQAARQSCDSVMSIAADVRIDYRLADFVTETVGRGEYTYAIPRFNNFPVIDPSFAKELRAFVIVDTSYSMIDNIPACVALINGLLASGIRVRVAMGDVHIERVDELQSVLTNYEIAGLGGTAMDIVYKEALQYTDDDTVIIMFTDCETDFPDRDEITVPLVVVTFGGVPPAYIPYLEANNGRD